MQIGSDFEGFISALTKRLEGPLPGAAAHEVMRAVPVGALKPKFVFSVPPRPGSVLILLFPDNGSVRFPLELRPDYQGAHSGQVSLPGGKAEAGEDFKDTALRECQEEIGVSKDEITIIGRLSDFFVMPSNFMVVPVVGVCWQRPMMKADPVEVVRILEGDINDLIKEDAIQHKELLAAKQFRMQASYFEVEGETVWGATAMMLNEFRMIVKEIIDK